MCIYKTGVDGLTPRIFHAVCEISILYLPIGADGQDLSILYRKSLRLAKRAIYCIYMTVNYHQIRPLPRMTGDKDENGSHALAQVPE